MICNYELMLIIDSMSDDKEINRVLKQVKKELSIAKATIYYEESMGMKELAYPINKKSNGYYQLFELKIDPSAITALRLFMKREEGIMRYMITKLDKHAIAYNESRRTKNLEQINKS